MYYGGKKGARTVITMDTHRSYLIHAKYGPTHQCMSKCSHSHVMRNDQFFAMSGIKPHEDKRAHMLGLVNLI